MIDSAPAPAVESHEVLARYVLHSSWIRSSLGTLKPDAFIPPSPAELSVTRHLQATDEDLWSVGREVASAQGRTLYGRGDISVPACRSHGLSVAADPVLGNLNHAIVIGWPTAKPEQKTIAQKLAAAATFVRVATPTE